MPNSENNQRPSESEQPKLYKVKPTFFGPFEQGRVVSLDDIREFHDKFTDRDLQAHVTRGTLVQVEEPRTTTPVLEGPENPNPDLSGSVLEEPASTGEVAAPAPAPAPVTATREVTPAGVKEEPGKKK